MPPSTHGIIESFVAHQGAMLIDGGLATALEARGCDLDDPLWSARILLDDPELIREVHRDYLLAGADCIITASYQASFSGLRARGLSDVEAAEVLGLAVSLAVEARDEFWSDAENRRSRLRPVVAASVGPFGAALADGSEYTGDYEVDDDELYAFHRLRWQVLADSEAELLACETIPSGRECRVLLKLLRETVDARAWFSFSCRDQSHLRDGSSVSEVAGHCALGERVEAVGINCTAPEFLPSLIAKIRAATHHPLIVYPNSGEIYDASTRSWRASPSPLDWSAAPRHWLDGGVSGVGGCCRVGPTEIAAMRRGLVDRMKEISGGDPPGG